MTDYICRKNMLNAVEQLDIIPSVDGMGNPTNAEDFRVQFLGTVLKVEPADVAPVVQGRWIKEYRAKGQVANMCTECGGETGRASKFCPHCGAKMVE